jgi:hypothetical protein
MKLKDLLKESNIWDRKFGQPLPTLKDAIEDHQLKELNEYEDPEKVAEDLVGVANELQSEFKRIKFDKIRMWGKKYHRSAPGLLNMLTNVLKWVKKIK